MARDYQIQDFNSYFLLKKRNAKTFCLAFFAAAIFYCLTGLSNSLNNFSITVLAGLLPSIAIAYLFYVKSFSNWIEKERKLESRRREGKHVIGFPPNRNAFEIEKENCRKNNKAMIDKYLVGFEIDSGQPIWVNDDEIIGHGAVFAKTGVGKTLWLESLMFQQMSRARASGLTFIDAKRDPGTLADIIMMALVTGRIEDLVVVDPFDPVYAYNFVFTNQKADVKARKVLRCGLPQQSEQSTTKHYDRLASDAIYRIVRAMESLGLAWSVKDVATSLSSFKIAYPRIKELLTKKATLSDQTEDAKNSLVELGHLAEGYRTKNGKLDTTKLTENLRGIASELHSIANSQAGEMFCAPKAELSLTDAILEGKIIYYMLPRLEEAESAARMVKVFREDLEISIGEITSSRTDKLEDPHLVIVDEGASTFGPTWANLFELARKGRFALLFGAQSIGGLQDSQNGLSKQFYDRVMANVNLKVMMRVGDNRTAEDMSNWIGKVNTKSKPSLSDSSSNSGFFQKYFKRNKSSNNSDDKSATNTDEAFLVSPEELKHEMSTEKGLAWFDKGDGILRKGRCSWVDSDTPANWEGREYLTKFETIETEEIGLAKWVDEKILSHQDLDKKDSKKLEVEVISTKEKSSSSKNKSKADKKAKSDIGPFRLGAVKNFKSSSKSRTVISSISDESNKENNN